MKNIGKTQTRILTEFEGLKSDAPLRDKDLVERLGITRNAVRKAMVRLVARGLIKEKCVIRPQNTVRFYYKVKAVKAKAA